MNDLQAIWAQIALPKTKAPRVEDAYRTLARAAWSQGLSALVDAAALLWMGGFLYDHRAEPRFLLPGLLLHAYLILSLVAQAAGFALARGVDYAAPIAAVQRRLAALTLLRRRSLQWTLLTAPLIWIPLLIVLFKGLLHADAYLFLPPAWLYANLAFGLAFIPIALYLSRRFAKSRLGRMFAGGSEPSEDRSFAELDED